MWQVYFCSGCILCQARKAPATWGCHMPIRRRGVTETYGSNLQHPRCEPFVTELRGGGGRDSEVMELTSSHYPVSDSGKDKFDLSEKQLRELRSVTA